MNPTTSSLIDFLLTRIAEEEMIARQAIDPDRPGKHWQWVTSETDVPVMPGEEEEALSHQPLSLRTVETYGDYDLPAFIIGGEEEGNPGSLRHIARWDPARVLAECEAKMRCVVGHLRMYPRGVEDPIKYLAMPYANHPDFQEEWRI